MTQRSGAGAPWNISACSITIIRRCCRASPRSPKKTRSRLVEWITFSMMGSHASSVCSVLLPVMGQNLTLNQRLRSGGDSVLGERSAPVAHRSPAGRIMGDVQAPKPALEIEQTGQLWQDHLDGGVVSEP